MKKKSIALLMALVLVFGMAVGGTVAWLMDSTDPVVNTFTVGDIEITLTETTEEYKVIPGTEIAKDPMVSVLKNSEQCWLFVTVAETNWNENLTYAIAEGWTKLENGVYYRVVEATTEDEPFYVLAGSDDNANGVVLVDNKLTSAEMENMETTQPTLTFTAYAIQYENFEPASDSADDIKAAAAAAWAEVKPA